MERKRCQLCGSFRFCLRRNGTTQCLACALEDISFLLSDLGTDIGALRKIASAGAPGVSTRPCPCGRVGALDEPYWSICAFCIGEVLSRRLETIRGRLRAVLQTCAYCGDTAACLLADQLPMCEFCASVEAKIWQSKKLPTSQA